MILCTRAGDVDGYGVRILFLCCRFRVDRERGQLARGRNEQDGDSRHRSDDPPSHRATSEPTLLHGLVRFKLRTDANLCTERRGSMESARGVDMFCREPEITHHVGRAKRPSSGLVGAQFVVMGKGSVVGAPYVTSTGVRTALPGIYAASSSTLKVMMFSR